MNNEDLCQGYSFQMDDIYTRLGRLEEGQDNTLEKLGEINGAILELTANLNGPHRLKERIANLESWRNKMVGGFLTLSFLMTILATAFAAVVAF